jgi:hypothetical protein
MSASLLQLKRMISEGRYEVDDDLLAETIMARIGLHGTVSARARFPAAPVIQRVRSFHCDRHARSFRLARNRVSPAWS